MVVLENIDIKNLSLNKFKWIVCPCELCDCGCFDRSKYDHNTDCKRKKSFTVSQVRPSTIGSHKKCPISHYKETFKANYNARPATTYQPPPDLFLYVPKGSMDLNTIQKSEYPSYGLIQRPQPYKSIDNHKLSSEPLNVTTSYNSDFPKSEINAFAQRVKKNSNQSTLRIPVGPISGKTTTGEHFSDWNTFVPTKGFSERFSYAGDSLFPTGERSFNTHTNSIHHHMVSEKKSNFLKSELKGTLVVEGDMDFQTDYRDTYVKYSDVGPAKKIIPNQNLIILKDQKKFIPSITQTRSDYIEYPNHHPPKMADCNPFISDLDKQIYPGNSYDHTTQYSHEFSGLDLKNFEKAVSFKPEIKPYKKPSAKLEVETVTMREYKPINPEDIPVIKAIKLPSSLKIPTEPMESQTMSQLHFLPYKIKPIAYAKDMHPTYYIPPISKFISDTTNSRTFKGEKGNMRVPCRPDANNIEKSGSMDLNSSYKEQFKNHGLSMCEAKAYFIAKSLEEKNQTNILARVQSSIIS